MPKKTEQQKIERLLGEEFDSLASARRALKKESEPIGPKKKLSSKRSYTLRDLPIKKQRKVQDYILELGGKADEIQALKKPGEMWYFSLFGNRSRLYEDINLLQPDLAAWAMSAQQEAHGKNSNDAVVHGIKLFKFRGKGVSANTELEDEDFETVQEQFSNIRRKAREQVRKEKKEIFEEASKALAPKRTKSSPTPTNTSLLKTAMQKLKAMQKEIDSLRRTNAPTKKQGKSKAKSANPARGKRASKSSTPSKSGRGHKATPPTKGAKSKRKNK